MPFLPQYSNGNEEPKLMLLVGERGVTEDECNVYDVVVHPNVYKACKNDQSGAVKEKVVFNTIFCYVYLPFYFPLLCL